MVYGGPVIETIRQAACSSQAEIDKAGIHFRGGDVYDRAIDGKFTHHELVEARLWAMENRANINVIRSIEGARPRKENIIKPS